MIPYENKVYGFVSVVVMNYKSKKHDFPGVWVSSKHMFTDSGPSCMAVRCNSDSIRQMLFIWETVMFIFAVM